MWEFLERWHNSHSMVFNINNNNNNKKHQNERNSFMPLNKRSSGFFHFHKLLVDNKEFPDLTSTDNVYLLNRVFCAKTNTHCIWLYVSTVSPSNSWHPCDLCHFHIAAVWFIGLEETERKCSRVCVDERSFMRRFVCAKGKGGQRGGDWRAFPNPSLSSWLWITQCLCGLVDKISLRPDNVTRLSQSGLCWWTTPCPALKPPVNNYSWGSPGHLLQDLI